MNKIKDAVAGCVALALLGAWVFAVAALVIEKLP